MNEVKKFSSVVSQIYDAALDPQLWPEVLERACEYVVGTSAAVVMHDVTEKTGQFFYSWNDDPEYTRLYFEKYVKLNPALVPVMSAKEGDVFAISSVIPHQEFLASRFYREWARPQGYLDTVNAFVEKTSTSVATVSIVRTEGQGVADEGALERMRLLSPHFRRALAVSKSIRQQRVEAATLSDALNSIEAALFIVDRGGHVAHMNTAAQLLAETGAVVRVTVDKKLVAVDHNATLLLKEAFLSADSGDASIGLKGVAITVGGEEAERWVAHVLPLTDGRRRSAGLFYSASAAVFIRRISPDVSTPVELAASLYKLTDAEVRVLFAIVNCDGVSEAARILGVAPTTVKSHLQSIFRKTETKRQSSLVKLVASLASPFAR